MKSILKDSHTFVIRFWREPREIEGAKPVWRGKIEHVDNGSSVHVKSMEEVNNYLEHYLKGITKKIEFRNEKPSS